MGSSGGSHLFAVHQILNWVRGADAGICGKMLLGVVVEGETVGPGAGCVGRSGVGRRVHGEIEDSFSIALHRK